MAERLEAVNKSSYISKRYIRVEEVASEYQISEEDMILVATEAGALYRLPRTDLIHKERLDDFMKHLYKVPGTNKQVVKKFVRIGEGSIIYSIGHHRFIEMARAAGAVYKIGTAQGNTILINLELLDEYMEQFREPPTEMKHPLPNRKGGD